MARRWPRHEAGPGTGSASGEDADCHSSRSYSFPCTWKATSPSKSVNQSRENKWVRQEPASSIFLSFCSFSLFSPHFFTLVCYCLPSCYAGNPADVPSPSALLASPGEWSVAVWPRAEHNLWGNKTSPPALQPHGIFRDYQTGKRKEAALGFVFPYSSGLCLATVGRGACAFLSPSWGKCE